VVGSEKEKGKIQMLEKNKKRGMGTGSETESGAGTKTENEIESHRLTINKMTEQALALAVERINEGFQGGKVNRSQVANWAIIRFNENLETEEIREIRAEYVDEFSALDAILRRAKGSGKLPPELRAYLQKEMGFEDATKKKGKKSLQENVINGYIKDEGIAA
jgi:hypothetical protein